MIKNTVLIFATFWPLFVTKYLLIDITKNFSTNIKDGKNQFNYTFYDFVVQIKIEKSST